MTFHVDFRSSAVAQVVEADWWWRENRPAAPGLLSDDLTKAVSVLQRTPDIGKTYRRRGIPYLRRLLMLRTQYHLYYIHAPGDEMVFVLALWGAVRRRGPPLRPAE